ncbi:MAG: hypothetical protein NXI09_06805 [Bacteroidetes bacterium]|nr:hypothetical protein [Bacteroidota bacterium]
MKNLHALCFLILTLGVLGCRPDVQPADWEVDTLVPILKTRLDIRDLTDLDTSLQSASDGQLQIVFREPLASLKPGEIAPPFNEEFENTAKLQTIVLGTRVIRNRISLGTIAMQMGLQGALLVAANGTSQVIPPISNVGPSNFNIDATDFFQSMTLRDGWLVLRLENNFPIDLTNLQYNIQNVNAGSFILQNTITSLPSGAVHYDSIRLINNFLIEGNLVASLVNLDSPGSNGNSVLVDTSDAIDLRVTLDKLDPVSATAVFPAQNLFDETAEAFIYPPSALLTSVHVAEGDIFMDAASTINDSINLSYILPGAVNQNGDTLQFLRVIPAAPNGQVVNEYVEIPVVDYNLELNGMPGSPNIHNTFYTTFIGSIDSTGRQISLSLQDSVFVRTGIRNLIADRGYGFLGYDTIFSNEAIEIEALSDFFEGNIELDDVQLSIEVENYIGAPFGFKILELNSSTENQQRSLSWNQLGFEFSVPRAQEPSPGAKPTPGRFTLSLDKNTSNIQDLVEIFPTSVDYKMEAYMNSSVPNSDFSQFLNNNYGIEANLAATIPIQVGLDSISLSDTTTFNYMEVDKAMRMNGGDLILKAANNYPFDCRVDIILLNNGNEVLDTLKTSDWILAAPLDADQRSIGEKETTLKIPIRDQKLWALQNTAFMIFKTSFRTDPQNGLVKIYSDNYIDLQLIADFKLSTD